MVRSCVLFTLLGVVTGCADEGVKKVIQSRIIIDIREDLYAGNRKLLLNAETEDGYSCGDYQILFRESPLGNNGLRIDFLGLSDGCRDNSAGPAHARVDLGDFPSGTYHLEINNGFMRNRGLLLVTPTDIKLEFRLRKGISFVREEMRRVPANTYWGDIASFTYLGEPKLQEFKKKLISLGAVFSPQIAGDYVYYRINAEGKIQRPEDARGNSEYIIFQFTGDERELKELIWYGERFNKGLYHININTYAGEQINNWSL